MAKEIDPKNFPDVHPASLASPVWRPGRVMAVNDPSRRAWVEPALLMEKGIEGSEAHKLHVGFETTPTWGPAS